MSRMRLAGLALIGLAACASPSPNRQSASRSTAGSRESTPVATSTTKPAARSTATRSATSTHRTTTATKQPGRRTTTTHPDTVKNAVNPLTNH